MTGLTHDQANREMELVVLQMRHVEMDSIVRDEPVILSEMSSSRRLKFTAPTKDVN